MQAHWKVTHARRERPTSTSSTNGRNPAIDESSLITPTRRVTRRYMLLFTSATWATAAASATPAALAPATTAATPSTTTSRSARLAARSVASATSLTTSRTRAWAAVVNNHQQQQTT